MGKWLLGGAAVAGALVLAIQVGVFKGSSASGSAGSIAAASGGEQPGSRKKARVTEDPELRSPNDPPRTVGNSPSSTASGSAPETEAGCEGGRPRRAAAAEPAAGTTA